MTPVKASTKRREACWLSPQTEHKQPQPACPSSHACTAVHPCVCSTWEHFAKRPANNFALISCTQADCAHQDHLNACIHVSAGIAHIGNHRLPPADGCHSGCCSRHLHTAATILTHIHHQALLVMSGTHRANNASTPVTNVRRNLPSQPAGECVNMQRARASQLQRSALRQVCSWEDPGDLVSRQCAAGDLLRPQHTFEVCR